MSALALGWKVDRPMLTMIVMMMMMMMAIESVI